jgi:hypothetical protein
LSGAATDAQVPNSITLDNLTQITTRAIADTTGILAGSRGGVGVALPTCSGTDKLTANGTQVSCAADQTSAGGGGGTVLRVSADVSQSTLSFADVTGLTMAVTGGTTYAFRCEITYNTAATTTALQMATNGPAITALDYDVRTATSATAWHQAVQTAHDTNTNPATGGGATRLPAVIAGTFIPSASGTFAIRYRSEVNASAVTVKRGSFCVVH